MAAFADPSRPSLLDRLCMNPFWRPEDVFVSGTRVGRIESAGDPVCMYFVRRGGGETQRFLFGNPDAAKEWAARRYAEGRWEDGFDELELARLFLDEIASRVRGVERLSPSRFPGLGLVRVFSPTLIHLCLDPEAVGWGWDSRSHVPTSYVCRSVEEARDVLGEAGLARFCVLQSAWYASPEGRAQIAEELDDFERWFTGAGDPRD